MELLIERTYFPNGTNGDLAVNGNPFCHTIELPWKDNKNGISCIPEDTYELKERHSEHHGDHLILEGTGKRELILIHPANDAVKELRGCIAPVTTLTGQGTGSESRKAFNPLIKMVYAAITNGEKVHITIRKKKALNTL
jgi:hypothetical protein